MTISDHAREEWISLGLLSYTGDRADLSQNDVAQIRALLKDLVTEAQGFRGAAERFVAAYEGNKAQMLGNGAARRALDEFRALLKDAATMLEP